MVLQFRGVRGASVSRFATRESRSLFAVRDGIDHFLQLRLNLPGLHETLAVLPEPLVNLQSLLAHFLQERVPGRVRGEGRVRGGAEEDVLGIRRERRARATRRCDRGRAGGIAASRRTTRARRNARFDPEKADGKRRVPRVDALVLAPEVHTIRSLLQGLLVGTGDDRHGANRRAGRPRHDVATRLRDDAHVGRTRGVCLCVVGTELEREGGSQTKRRDTAMKECGSQLLMRTTRENERASAGTSQGNNVTSWCQLHDLWHCAP